MVMLDADWMEFLGNPDAEVGEAALPVPRAFTAFTDFIDVKLTDGQYAIALVAYDGLTIAEADARMALERPGADLPSSFFGGDFEITDVARRIFLALCGGRAGKTYALGSIRLLHLALTVSLETMAPGEVASAPIFAPDLALALQALNYVKGALAHPRIRRFVVDANDIDIDLERESVQIRRDDGDPVTIVCRAANAQGKSGRGRSLVGALLDEAAFFFDSSYKVNDSEIYKAIVPRVLIDGQLVVATTPWGQSGIAYELFRDNFAEPSRAGLASAPKRIGGALVAHAPSVKLMASQRLKDVVALEYKRDPDNANREFGAMFMATSALDFIDPHLIDAAVFVGKFTPEPGDEVLAGIDLGFRSNSSALVIVYRRKGVVFVAVVLERKPEGGVPLKPGVVMQDFAEVLVKTGTRAVMADGHYRDTALEYLSPVRVGLLDAPASPAEVWLKVRDLFRESRIRLPDHDRLLRQLKGVKAKATSGGGLTIILPRWPTGEHGDLVAAMALAVYQAAGVLIAETPEPGSDEAVAARERARIAEKQRAMKNDREPPWRRR